MTASTAISDVCKNPIELLEKYKESGINVLGYSCSYIPEELIISGGLQPYRIPNLGSVTSPLVPTFICQFASAVLQNILRLEEFFSGFVIAHTCDPMWRLYDIVKKKARKPIFFLRVPHNVEGELSIDFFKKELLRFKRFLEENFDVEINNEALRNAIEVCNMNRNLLKEVYMRNSNGKNRVNGLYRLQLTLASMWMPKKEVNTQIKSLSLENNATRTGNVRIHINGTAIYDLNIIEIVENAGCFIASDDLCTGSRYFWDNVNDSEDLIRALANRYMQRTPCPSHEPIEKRLQFMDFMIEKFKVQGVLTIANRFCDPMLYEAVHVREMLTKKHVPVMLIDYENLGQEAGRIKARIEAFIESLSELR
ncbi:MAG: 2-hydroxyacyl-CoA dehydratase family protein [Candidatus Bathyarchaeia archaeon]